MKTALHVLALLQLFAAPACAENLYFNSKLDLSSYSPVQRPRHPAMFSRTYIGSPRSYAAEPKEIRMAGKALTTGIAAAGAVKAQDPLSTAGFLLIGIFSVRDLTRAINQPRQRSNWSFLWSRGKN